MVEDTMHLLGVKEQIMYINNLSLHYKIKGQGKRNLILIHGNTEDMKTFDHIEDYLGDVYTIYLLDSRSHGLSEKIYPLHYEDMAQDVYQFIQKLEIKDPYVFGFSDGGNVALILEILYPQTIQKMMLAGANVNPSGLGDVLQDLQREYEETQSPYIKLMLDEPNLSAEQLQSIASDVLVLRGEFDVITKEHTVSFSNKIPNAKYVEIEGHDHSSYVMDPKVLSSLIKKYW